MKWGQQRDKEKNDENKEQKNLIWMSYSAFDATHCTTSEMYSKLSNKPSKSNVEEVRLPQASNVSRRDPIMCFNLLK